MNTFIKKLLFILLSFFLALILCSFGAILTIAFLSLVFVNPTIALGGFLVFCVVIIACLIYSKFNV